MPWKSENRCDDFDELYFLEYVYPPRNLLVEVDNDVTVTSTRMVTFLGELVMEKLFTDVDEFAVWVKKGVEPPTSCFAVISILTPPPGNADLIVTIKGKSGPGLGNWLLPLAGFNSTLNAGSLPPPPPPLFLQLPLANTADNKTK
jgi:hypothetical protein